MTTSSSSQWSTILTVESHTVEPVAETEPVYKMCCKRYTLDDSAWNTSGLTLVLTHCIAAHKEQWEPCLERLFKLQQRKDGRLRIREAWSLDRVNHGDSAVANEDILKDPPKGSSVYDWSPAILHLLRSERLKGHRIVAIGHSAGAGALVLPAKSFPLKHPPYVSLILVEPSLVTEKLFNEYLEDRMAQMDLATGVTAVRRDSWDGREDAYNWLRRKFPWKTWDSRVVRIYSEHGLRSASSGLGVKLKGDKMQESASYRDQKCHSEATDMLATLCHSIPVHLIWGQEMEIMPQELKDSLSDASEGRKMASVSSIRGAGHMVVQEQPDALADALSDILEHNSISKL